MGSNFKRHDLPLGIQDLIYQNIIMQYLVFDTTIIKFDTIFTSYFRRKSVLPRKFFIIF